MSESEMAIVRAHETEHVQEQENGREGGKQGGDRGTASSYRLYEEGKQGAGQRHPGYSCIRESAVANTPHP